MSAGESGRPVFRLIELLPGGILNTLPSIARRFLHNRRVGVYQRDVLLGIEPWSGYKPRYRRAKASTGSRRALAAMLADIRLAIRTGGWTALVRFNGRGGELVYRRLVITTDWPSVSPCNRCEERYLAVVKHAARLHSSLNWAAQGLTPKSSAGLTQLARLGSVRLALARLYWNSL